MIKAIVFDLWETLATKQVGVSKTLQERFNLPKTENFTRKYEEAIQLYPWKHEEDMAKNFLLQFQLEQDQESVGFVIKLFQRAIDNAILLDGIYHLLVALKNKGYKLGLLSNTSIFESIVLEKLGIKNLLDATVFSWQIGNLKPEEAAFTHIIAELKTTEEEILFIDDVIKNVDAAEKLGMQTILFSDTTSLKNSLQEKGVL